jgi:hypothetical protein
VPIDKTIDLAAMTGRQKGNDGPEMGRAPVSIADLGLSPPIRVWPNERPSVCRLFDHRNDEKKGICLGFLPLDYIDWSTNDEGIPKANFLPIANTRR